MSRLDETYAGTSPGTADLPGVPAEPAAGKDLGDIAGRGVVAQEAREGVPLDAWGCR